MKWLILFSFFSLCSKPTIERSPYLTDKTWVTDSIKYTDSESILIPDIDGVGHFSFHLYKGGSLSTPCDSATGACPVDYNNGYPNNFWFKLYGNTLYVDGSPFPDTGLIKFEYSDLTNTSVTMVYMSYGERDTFYMSSD